MSDCYIFNENLQKYLKCTGNILLKFKLVYTLKIKQCSAENCMGNNVMKMIQVQYTLAVKTVLINQCRNMGYVCFVRYHSNVLFKNNIFE